MTFLGPSFDFLCSVSLSNRVKVSKCLLDILMFYISVYSIFYFIQFLESFRASFWVNQGYFLVTVLFENCFGVYSYTLTTLVSSITLKLLFLKLLNIFLTDRQTDRQTEKVGHKSSSQELKKVDS